MSFTVTHAGVETRVNTTTIGNQNDANLTTLADGGWVVTWTSPGDGAGLGVFQQRYSATGQLVGIETPVNSNTASDQSQPTITALVDGGWVVAWTSDGQDGSAQGIYLQQFDKNGAKVNGEQPVNTFTTGSQSSASITALKDGGWLVTWDSAGQDSDLNGIYQQCYNADGTKHGSEARVNVISIGAQSNASVTGLADGGWVVTFTSPDAAGAGVYQRHFAADGTGGVQSQVNTTTNSNQLVPSVTGLTGGGWVVTWQSDQSGGRYGVYEQLYDASGNKVGVETLVNTTTTGLQQGPSVTATPDGGWIVAFMSDTKDGSSWGIVEQHYAATGEKIGGEILVNTFTTGTQGVPNITTTLPGGGHVVAWESALQDGNQLGIYQRAYMSSGSSLTTSADFAAGTGGNDTLFVAAETLGLEDELYGLGGTDTLAMTSAGTLNLNAPAVFSGVEVLIGSAGDDTIVASVFRLAGLAVIVGNGGRDVLKLTGAGSFDFSGMSVLNMAAIELQNATSAIKIDDKSLAALVHGVAGANDSVTLTNGTFTVQERGALFQNGITTVVDGTGTHSNAAPTAISINGSSANELSIAGAEVGILSTTDANGTDDEYTYSLVDDAGGRFAISGNKIVVKDGLLLDFEQAGSHQVTVQVKDAGGLSTRQVFTIGVLDVGSETATGLARNNTLIGGGGADRFEGGIGDDVLKGGAGQDVLKGLSGKDILEGGIGNDTLEGGAGVDRLTGNAGLDNFVFNSAIQKSTSKNKSFNLDTITDFYVKDDTISLSKTIFKEIGKKGHLAADAFYAGKSAHDASDRILYDSKTGALLYDDDGIGSHAAVQFAALSRGLKLNFHDFLVI